MTELTATLRAAAAKLRAAHEAATPSPWRAVELPPDEYDKHPARWVEAEYEVDGMIDFRVVADCPWRQADADLIAMLRNIPVELAELLEDEAAFHDKLMAVARAILSEPKEGEPA